MTPETLASIGAALYGPQWVRPMARALGRGARGLQRIAASAEPLHPALAARIAILANNGATDLMARAAALEASASASGDSEGMRQCAADFRQRAEFLRLPIPTDTIETAN